MAESGGSSIRWSRWIALSGACIVSGAAFWWYLRRRYSNISDSTKSDTRQTVLSTRCPELLPGLQSSKEMKDRGNEYFKQCCYDKAVEAFTEAINLCPAEYKTHLAVCYQNRAATYDRLRDPERSVTDCTKALELDPFYFKAVVRRAKACLSLNSPEKALDDLTYASIINPEASELLKTDVDSAVALAAANLVEHVKSTRESIPVRDELVLLWRSAYVNDPILYDLKKEFVSPSPYHQALEAIRQRHYEEVIPLVQNDLSVLQSDPDNLDITCAFRDYILLARFALMKENVTSLKEHLTAFNDLWNMLDEESRGEILNKRFRAMYHILLAAWKILEHCNDVKSELEHAVEIDQTNVDVYLGAALLLSENGQLQEAIDYLDTLYKIDPAHHLVKHMRANCMMALKASMGDVGGAMACMSKVDQLLQRNQNADPVLYLITGRLYYAAQNKELAKASFAKAAEGIPDFAAPMFYLAMVEAEEMEGSPDQMAVLESKMKVCLQREKANPDALAILAKIAFQRQELDDALNLYEQCIDVCPVRTNETSLLPAVMDYVQIRSLRKAVEALRHITPPSNVPSNLF